MPELRVARSELILGAPHGGQVARAEAIAARWLSLSSGHEAIHVATAQAWDGELRERVTQGRAAREACLRTAEEPLALAHALGAFSRPGVLVVVDCLTLWLTALMMRAAEQDHSDTSLPLWGGAPSCSLPLWGRAGEGAPSATIADAIAACAGPLVLIGHAAGAGQMLQGRDARQFADTLGRLDWQAAVACERVTLMSRGLAMVLKGAA